MGSWGISFIDKEMKNTLLFMTLLAALFSLVVTQGITIPHVILYGLMFVVGGAIFFKGMSNPEVFAYMLVAYMPYSKVLAGDFGGFAKAVNATNLLMGAIIFAWISGRYTENESKWVKAPMNAPILLFILVGMIGIFRASAYSSSFFDVALVSLKRWITPLFMYFLILNTVKKKRMIQIIVVIMMIVTTLVGLMAIYDYINFSGGSFEKSRVGSIAGHSNTLAAFFCYYMFLPLGFFYMNMQNFRAWLLLIPFLIQFRGIMVTFSRGGYLAFAAGLLGITFIRSKALFFGIILFFGLAFVFPQLLPSGIRYRMAQTVEKKETYDMNPGNIEEDLEASSRTRIEIWKGAIKMIKAHPFLGVGYGLFYDRIKDYWSGGGKIDAHNTYLIIAGELGIPALIIFLWMIMVAFWQSLKLYYSSDDPFSKAVGLGLFGGVCGLLLSNMFGSRLNSEEVASYFFILSALVMRLHIIHRNQEHAPENQSVLSNSDQTKQRISGKLDACWFED